MTATEFRQALDALPYGQRLPGAIYLIDPGDDPRIPALLRITVAELRKRLDIGPGFKLPILHRKETFLPPEHPLHGKFAKLTHQEEAAGLLDDTSRIGFPRNNTGASICLETPVERVRMRNAQR